MIPKSSQNRVGIRIGLPLCVARFVKAKLEPTIPEHLNIPYVKQAFPQIAPFPFDHRFGTKKSPKPAPTPLHNPSKKHPENTSKINTKFHRFWIQNDPPNEPQNPPKIDPGGTVGPHGTLRGPKRRSRPPRGNQNGGPGPL